MAARKEDAKKGYELFLLERGKISRSEINSKLAAVGARSVSQRTYTHYGRLLANGFRYYIPINHLDVYLSLGGDRIIAERRRFNREPGGLEVFYSFNGIEWKRAASVDDSSVGFGLVTDTIIQQKPLTSVSIRIDGHHDIPCVLAWKKIEGSFTRFGVRANNFISAYSSKGKGIAELPRPLGRLTIIRAEDGKIDWQKFANTVHRTNQFILAVEELIYFVSNQSSQALVLARPILESIEFHSPGKAPLKIDKETASLAKVLIDNFKYPEQEERLRNAGVRSSEAEADIKEAEARKAVAEADDAELNLLMKQLAFANQLTPEYKEQLVNIVHEHFISRLGAKALPSNFLKPGTPERAIFERKVLPRGMELMNPDDPEFRYTVYEDE